MPDLQFQNLSTVQSNLQPLPPTIASASVISPTAFLTFISGSVQIATINPPVSGAHMLIFIFTNGAPGAFATTGNIKTATAPAQNIPVVLVYDPITALYWSGKLS
jgi:hypothetical protein